MWVPNKAISPRLAGTRIPSSSITLVSPALHVLRWIPVKVYSQLSSCLPNTGPERAGIHFPGWTEFAALTLAFLLRFTALLRSSHTLTPDAETSLCFSFFSCCMWAVFWLLDLLFLAGRKIQPCYFFACSWIYIRPLKGSLAGYNCTVLWGLQGALHWINYWSMETNKKPYVCLDGHLSGLRFAQR